MHLLSTQFHLPIERYAFLCSRWCRYFEHAECESPYELRPLLESVEVWKSANIKTHYTLGCTTVTKSEGGSSVEVDTEEDTTAKLRIYVSADRHTRDCALITDFPEQLVEALELEPADLPYLHPILQVPLASLKALLIRKGITSGDAADDYEESSVADLANEDWRSQNDGSSSGDDGEHASTTSASSSRSDSVQSAAAEYTRALVRSEAANTTLRPHVVQRTSSRPTTPEPRSQDHLNMPADESPHERPSTPFHTAAGLYSSDNRKRNIELLQNFARNANLTSSSRSERSSGRNDGGGSAFDMNSLREILEALEPAPVSTPVQVDPRPQRQAGWIPNRNGEEMARDFEVGFLGEQFVSP